MKSRGSSLAAVLVIGISALTMPLKADATDVMASLSPCYAKGLKDKLLCGSIKRPISSNEADGQFDLHFTIIPAIKNAFPDEAVIAFAGGPGQSATEIAASFEHSLNVVRQHRAIVLVDQRGTGKSKLLQCDNPSFVEGLAAVDNGPEALEDVKTHTQVCKEKLNVDLSHFTTRMAAPDFEAVREYLGYKKVHLYGGSYGTRIAQEYARQFGQHVLTMTLDGVVPMQQSLVAIGKAIEDSLHALFADCEAQVSCAQTYPNLGEEFSALMQQLSQTPVRTTLKHPRTYEDVELYLTDVKFYSTIRMSLYSNSQRALVPLVIRETKKGNYAPFMGLMSSTDLASALAMGMHNAIVCGEDWPIQNDLPNEVVATPISELMAAGLNVICPILNVAPAERDFYLPLNTEIPTLLLSGGLDPATPPSWAELAMVKMKNATHWVAPTATHIVAAQTCADRLVADFIQQGNTQSIDPACLRKDTKSQFFINLHSVEAETASSKE
ncbi:FIG032621: Hydrolase, alpha/beta hydrolase fold family [Pseudoalteromonas luteoviolacea B = ATCC 29581]|nr:FIG032621: Hydrolase, alpha/beta hydrolase fold family [Pseudoalteromonas luteoviolacea B = ATCC 29581]